MSLQLVILAAGQGTRMKSDHPKVLHQVAGLAMIDHVMEAGKGLTEEKPIVVIGHQAEVLAEHLGDRAVTVLQKEQLGTGHAVMMAMEKVTEGNDVMILCGDTPLIQEKTLQAMVEKKSEGYDGVILSTIMTDPTGYGRILREGQEQFCCIREQKDASTAELEVQEINGGMYLFDGDLLRDNLKKLRADNAQGEYYLTDIPEHMVQSGHSIGIEVGDPVEILGVNTRVQLATAEAEMKKRINQHHMLQGVSLIDPASVTIEKQVEIGADTIIYPGCHLRGKTVLGKDCVIKEGTVIENATIGSAVTIRNSTIVQSVVGDGSTVGPYAYLRPGSVLGERVKIGDFVEVKNATIGDGSKASHLSYIGDAKVGKDVNIGCGVVFVNYDGKGKHQSIVKDKAFIGSNVNLVAPVTVEEGGYIATGSTVTIDVPGNSLCVARAREVIKEDWRLKK